MYSLSPLSVSLVGNVVELAHRGLDFGTHIGRDVAGVVDHQRNGA